MLHGTSVQERSHNQLASTRYTAMTLIPATAFRLETTCLPATYPPSTYDIAMPTMYTDLPHKKKSKNQRCTPLSKRCLAT